MVCLQLLDVVRTKLTLAQDKFMVTDYFHLCIDDRQGEIDYCIIMCQHGQ